MSWNLCVMRDVGTTRGWPCVSYFTHPRLSFWLPIAVSITRSDAVFGFPFSIAVSVVVNSLQSADVIHGAAVVVFIFLFLIAATRASKWASRCHDVSMSLRR